MFKEFLEVMIREGYINEDKAIELMDEKDREKFSLENILENYELINEQSLIKVLQEKFKIKKVELNEKNISEEAIAVFSKDIVNKYCVMPFKLKENKLHLAMSNPLNSNILEDISFISNKVIIPYYEKRDRILYFIERYYHKRIIKETLEDLKLYNLEINKKQEVNLLPINEGPVISLTNSIINEAINGNASDIHLEPRKEGALVRFRIDGILIKQMIIPENIYPAVCTRIKIKSRMDISKKMVPQDGKMDYAYNHKDLDLRVSTMPTIYGEKIVIRILYELDKIGNLTAIMVSERERKQVENILKNRSGIILICGPTGSGKTTTLNAMINQINMPDKNIITIEDPVEYIIPGVNQINVNNKAGLNFSTGLRSLLRQDPDVIMIGEIRDKETAEIAIKAGITGHLVLSTLHTRSAFDAAIRLADMGIPKYLIGDSLLAVISQRLVRKICSYCKRAYNISEKESKFLKLEGPDKLYKGEGCSNCSNSGYSGRIAVFEILKVNDDYRSLIKINTLSQNLNEFILKNSIYTLKDNLIQLVKAGITSVDEMMRVYYEEY